MGRGSVICGVGRFSPTTPKLSLSRADLSPPLEKGGTGFECTRPAAGRAPSFPLLLRPPQTLPTPITKQRGLRHRRLHLHLHGPSPSLARWSLPDCPHPRSPATMQYPDDTEDFGATSGDETDQEDEVDAHVAGADGEEAKQEGPGLEANKAKQEESGLDADEAKQEESGSDAADDVEAGSDADDDNVQADAPAAGLEADGDLDALVDEANVRATGTKSDSDDDEAADGDEEVEADPAGNRRANLVVAASLLLAAIVMVTATLYAPPLPDVTHGAHQQGTCTSPVGCSYGGFGL